MTAENHAIWSNYNLDLDDWRDDLLEEYPDKSEDELYALMYEHNDLQLDDERVNLNIQMPGSILMIADIGQWNGRFPGYQEIKSGNIKDCLYTNMDLVFPANRRSLCIGLFDSCERLFLTNCSGNDIGTGGVKTARFL